MELTVQNVYGLLLRSKLLTVDEARSMYSRWQKEAKDAANLPAFAAWMVANRYLTDYQATLLARGHADGFFLNDYKIIDRLGKGRMAGVYKAQHKLGQIVAIKVLPPSRAHDANLLNRFLREARLAMKLKHPNIVRAFQVGQAAQSTGEVLHYMVMEYLEGETLEDVLARRGKLPPAEAVRLVHQALEGLEHIHSHGLVHRDLKPSNMMLAGAGTSANSTQGCTLKILDLGLGRALFDAGTDGRPGADNGLTAEGVLLGTPDYMSPEQARDPRGIDIRADIYSLGCVLYHLLSGRLPFPDSNLVSQMIRHATEVPPPLKDFNPAVPDGLQQIVNWMMAKDPNQRYPTPERAAQALQMFLAAGAPEALAAPEADPKMRPYLTWLEGNKEEGDDPPTLPPVALPVTPKNALPAAKPARGDKPARHKPPAAASARPGEKSASDKHRALKEKAKRPSTPAAVDLATGSAPALPDAGRPGRKPKDPATHPVVELPAAVEGANEAADGLDVDLVPVSPGEPGARSLLDPRVDRRDFLVFGLGVAAGGLAVGGGCWLALRRRNRTPPPEADTAEEK